MLSQILHIFTLSASWYGGLFLLWLHFFVDITQLFFISSPGRKTPDKSENQRRTVARGVGGVGGGWGAAEVWTLAPLWPIKISPGQRGRGRGTAPFTEERMLDPLSGSPLSQSIRCLCPSSYQSFAHNPWNRTLQADCCTSRVNQQAQNSWPRRFNDVLWSYDQWLEGKRRFFLWGQTASCDDKYKQ